MENTIVIILASGSGSRYGASLPKQYCDLAGRPLLMHTIDCFSAIMPIKNILLVIDGVMTGTWLTLCDSHHFISPRIVYGGATRTESLAKALEAVNDLPDTTTVMIHDGARPLASKMLISRMAKVPDGYAGAVPAVHVTDTLRHVEADGSSTTVNRSEYLAVQTPQTFHLGTLRKAFADYQRHSATDDASMVERVTGGKIAIVEGDHRNIKVTNPGDIAIAEAILRSEAIPSKQS